MNEITYTELRRKEVVNLEDGRKLGQLCDIVFDRCTGRILGFVVPGCRKLFNFFKTTDLFIPFHSICKIGDDTILVQVCYGEPIKT